MWLLSLRDLQWRRRRFIIAVLATALVFAMTILMTGITTSMRAENRRVVFGFGADAWLVARGTSGPFTASTVIPATDAERVAAVRGVRAADPMIGFRSTLGRTTLKDVNILGFRPGGIGTPELATGRMLRAKGEVLADGGLGLGPGDSIRVSGHDLKVVGTVSGVSTTSAPRRSCSPSTTRRRSPSRVDRS